MNENDPRGPKARRDIADDIVDRVVGPILDELEQTARTPTGPRAASEVFRRPRAVRAPAPRDAASGALELGLRAFERAASMPRRIVSGLMPSVSQPAPPPPVPSAAGRQRAARQVRDDIDERPARSVRSPLMGRPDTLAGSRRARAAAPPGRRARQVLTVQNHSARDLAPLRFRCSDLVSRTGGLIPGSAVTFEPASLELPARSSASLAVTVRIPFGQVPGRYTGIVETTRASGIRTILEIDVA